MQYNRSSGRSRTDIMARRPPEVFPYLPIPVQEVTLLIEILNGTHETVSYRSMSGVRAYINTDAEDFPLHWHTALEIIHPVENEYRVKTNGNTVTFYPGDILLLPPGELHALYAPAEGKRLILQFDYSLFSGLSGMDFLLHAMRPCLLVRSGEAPDMAAGLSRILHEITAEYTGDDPFREPAVRSLLLRFFVLLGRSVVTDAGRLSRLSPSRQQEYIEKFIAVCDHINSHCTEPLEIGQLARMAGFSRYHFSRLFKQFTGLSCHEYVISRRLSHAERLLLSPDLSVTEAAMQSGFHSISTFNRIFREKNGCTPSSYRSLNRGMLLGNRQEAEAPLPAGTKNTARKAP